MITVDELLQAGAHIGHKKSKWNPKMAPFVFGVRNSLHIIDITRTLDLLNEAIEFLKESVKNGDTILWVGARVQSKELIEETAKELGMPYVVGRWIGGLFTNYKVIKERVKYFNDLEHKAATGGLSQYTKKEQLEFSKKIAKLNQVMGGIKKMEKLPQIIFITDIADEKDAILEARKVGIKVVGLADTSADPMLLDYPIPANNNSIASLKLVVNSIKKELLAVRV